MGATDKRQGLAGLICRGVCWNEGNDILLIFPEVAAVSRQIKIATVFGNWHGYRLMLLCTAGSTDKSSHFKKHRMNI